MSAFAGFAQDLLIVSGKGAAVAVFVALALALGARRLPPMLRHALWLVVFVRLLIPVLPASPWSLLALGGHLEGVGADWLPGLNPDLLDGPAGAVAAGAEAVAAGGGPALAEGAWAAVGAVWLLGLLVLCGRAARQELRLRRRLQGTPPANDPDVLASLAEARRACGVTRRVPVLESQAVTSPALHGSLRPRILLPRDAVRTLGTEGLRHALLHELVHVRRWDGATRLVARLAAAVHWFNPAAWYALSRLEAECELACDAAVLARLGDRERTGYGHTLLHAATLSSPGAAGSPGGLGSAVTALPLSTHRTLKRRVQMIARYRSPSRRHLAALCLAAGALAFVALTDAPLRAAPADAVQEETSNAAERADEAKAKRTLQAMRDGGTGMFSWVTDQIIASDQASAESFRADSSGAATDAEPERETPDTITWAACPAISYEELNALLVPDYIAELPRRDGWGHDLQYCLDREPTEAQRWIAGIRSPGRDGAFQSDIYTAGPFAASAPDRDVVWMDGYFITWPSAEAGK